MSKEEYKKGLRDGIPIGLGYFAVSFSLGIYAAEGGIRAIEGFFASLFTLASAGEYAGFTVIAERAAYFEMVLVILVANCRYILMSCSMSQRLDPRMRNIHRIFMGAFITDEIFGASISRSGYLKPEYTYGLATSSALPWALGTALGIAVGNLLPIQFVNAMSVALYGMFIAIIVPPAKEKTDIAIAVVLSFDLSYISKNLGFFKNLSEGLRVVILTVVIALLMSLLAPVKEEKDE